MSDPRPLPRRNIIIAAAVLAAAAGFFIFIVPSILMSRAQSLLTGYGFEGAQIGSVSSHQGDVLFSDIKLDPEGFSSISLLRARPHWGRVFSASGFFDDIIIDRLVLTVDLTEGGLPVAETMNILPGILAIDADNIRINAINIDMNTPKGVIAVMAKAAMTRQEDGVRRLDGAIWGSQFQLGVDTRWDATIKSKDEWKTAAEIRELRFSLGSLTLSRGNGWFSAQAEDQSVPVLSGQISAGQFRVGERTTIGNINMTIDGSPGTEHITLTGMTGPKQDIAINVDLINREEGLTMQAAAQTKSAESLLAFIAEVSGDLQSSALNAPGLMELLITPGNLARLRQDIKKTPYDSLTLNVAGNWESMSGKIIAQKQGKKGGTPKTGVISLNPMK